MKFSKRKTKIVATIGPASRSREIIREMIMAGMNVVRLNFSHGTHDEHAEVLRIVREESEALGARIAVFQDLCGPKVRIGTLQGGQANLSAGDMVDLRSADGREGDATNIFVEAFDPAKVVRPGEKVLLSDGQIELVVTDVQPEYARCQVTAGGVLRSKQGIAVPDSRLSLSCLTEKDLSDLTWGVSNNVDYIALSFVGTPADVDQLKQEIRTRGGDIPVISKIERGSSLDFISEIVSTSDAIMVARGDLGLELPLERVPAAQKLIIDTCNHHGTPVITATQMLQSMVRQLRPTRAEVTDVCTAVRDGTDAVMLSEETAIGCDPVNVIKTLDRILKDAEREFRSELHRLRLRGSDQATVADAICFAANGAATKVSATGIVACTSSGHTAGLMAKYRPHQTLYGVTSEARIVTRMALIWGVHPVLMKLTEELDTEEEINRAMSAVREQYGVKPGSRVVITAGLKAKQSGSTNIMQIREIARV